jgi:hypothetical protein
LANGSTILLDGVFKIEFCLARQDMSVPVAVFRDLPSDAIIGINLIRQEQLIFNAASNQVIFSAMKGSHNCWKQRQVTTCDHL